MWVYTDLESKERSWKVGNWKHQGMSEKSREISLDVRENIELLIANVKSKDITVRCSVAVF